jgi:hypothetical protein
VNLDEAVGEVPEGHRCVTHGPCGVNSTSGSGSGIRSDIVLVAQSSQVSHILCGRSE